MGAKRLNLPEIDATLRAVQTDFAIINRSLHVQRDAMSDEVRGNMMAGYRCVDELIAGDIDPFKLGNVRHLLELNTRVLCGTGQGTREDYARHIAANEKRFYDKQGGGIGALTDWLRKHPGDNVWNRAAGVYIQILSQPELFIEGNHRTGALIMSYMLAREGQPPFVLSPRNAKAYFDPSSLVKVIDMRGLKKVFRLRMLKRRLENVLRTTADASHLLPAHEA